MTFRARPEFNGTRGATRSGLATGQATARAWKECPVTVVIDPLTLPPTFSVLTASQVLGIGKNQTYRLIEDGSYPLPVLGAKGRYKVSKWDLLRYLRVPGYFEPEQAQAAAR